MSEVYTERFTAKVNKEGDFHEIIFRGEKSAHSFALRNARGTSQIEDGKVYDVTITESAPEIEQRDEALKGGDEAAPEKTLEESTGTKRKK